MLSDTHSCEHTHSLICAQGHPFTSTGTVTDTAICQHTLTRCSPKQACVTASLGYLLASPAHCAHFNVSLYVSSLGFPGGSVGKESACNAGDLGLIPGLGRSPGEGNGCPLQYSGLENSMDRGDWQATVMGSQSVGHDQATFTFTLTSMCVSSD